MTPPPLAVGRIVCEKAIIEEGTRDITLVGALPKVIVERFPSQSRSFFIYALLTNGLGPAKIDIVVTHLETDQEVYTRQYVGRFPDRLAELRLLAHLRDLSFFAAGSYLFALLVDGDLVAQRRVLVRASET
jgi:hypothetical protein